MTIEQLARNYAKAHPRRSNGTTWAGFCAALIYQVTRASIVYPSATAAGNAAHIESTDPHAAPIGAIHYWTGGNKNLGHVALDVRGRGRLLFMATLKVDEVLGAGSGLGMASFDSYAKKATGLTYRGWSRAYGANPVTIQASDLGQYGDPAPAPAQSSDAIAAEVIAGKWGNGADRIARLNAAGYDPATVQAAVNARLAAPAQSNAARLEALASAVLRGEYGNGPERKRRLGGDYAAVQAIVNRRLAK